MGIIIVLIWLISMLALPYGLFSLVRSLAWSVVHHREHVGREDRRRDRKARYDEHVAQSVEQIDAPRGEP